MKWSISSRSVLMAPSISSPTDQYSEIQEPHGWPTKTRGSAKFQCCLVPAMIIFWEETPDSCYCLTSWFPPLICGTCGNSPNPPAVPNPNRKLIFIPQNNKQEAAAASKYVWFLSFWNARKQQQQPSEQERHLPPESAGSAYQPPATSLPPPRQIKTKAILFFICRLSDNAWRIP